MPPAAKPVSFLKTPTLVVWALFVLSIPFYVGDSGVPQPGNVLIFLVVPLSLAKWNGRLPRQLKSPFAILLGFTVWVVLVDLAWALITDKWTLSAGYILYPTYYIYNVSVFLVVLVLFQRFGDVFLKVTVDALSVMVVFQVAASFALGGGGIRGSVFFNNPNQLGYYALLVACFIALCQPRLKLGVARTTAVLLGCAYLATISASRAAVGGIAILFMLLTFTNRKVLVVSFFVVIATTFVGGPLSHVLDATEKRVEYRKDESLIESRGYDRLWTFKEYLPLGAGEGGFERFADRPSKSKEIHSSAATVLFSYGIVGAALFLMFVVRVLAGAPLRDMLFVVPVIAYTVTHQGLRFTMLWILLAVFLAIKTRREVSLSARPLNAPDARGVPAAPRIARPLPSSRLLG